MKMKLPKFKSDKALEQLVEGDISKYINKQSLIPITFEFAPKAKVVNLRVSEGLLSAVKAISKKRGIPYQRYIREALEHSIKKDSASD